MLFALVQLLILIAVVPSKCWVCIFATEPARPVWVGHTGEVQEVTGVICGGRSGKNRGEEAEILSIDGELLGVQCPVDLLPDTKAGRGAWRRGGDAGQCRQEAEK